MTEQQALLESLRTVLAELIPERKIAYTANEAARLLSVDPKRVRLWVRQGVLKAIPYSKLILISHVELERFATSDDPR